MEKMWVVILDKPGKDFDFRDGFFPRRFYYKKDAQELIKEVEQKGGEAHLSKEFK